MLSVRKSSGLLLAASTLSDLVWDAEGKSDEPEPDEATMATATSFATAAYSQVRKMLSCVFLRVCF